MKNKFSTIALESTWKNAQMTSMQISVTELRLRSYCIFSFLGSLLAITNSLASVNYTDHAYQVSVIRPGGDRACTLFQLVGVTQADATLVPGSAWFAIPNSAPEYKEMVATLLLAKATDRGIYVETSGVVPSACGHSGVSVITLP